MKAKYLCEDVILECEEEEMDEEVGIEEDVAEIESSISDDDGMILDDLSFDQWVAQGYEESSQDDDDDFNVNESLEEEMDQDALNVDPNVKVSADRIDVFCEGKSLKPFNDETKAVLSRLREVYSSKAKEFVPSLKSRNQVDVKKQLRLVNGVAGNLAVDCCSISEVNHFLYTCSLVVARKHLGKHLFCATCINEGD